MTMRKTCGRAAWAAPGGDCGLQAASNSTASRKALRAIDPNLRDRREADHGDVPVGDLAVAAVLRRGGDHAGVRLLVIVAGKLLRADVELAAADLEPNLVGVLAEVDEPARMLGRAALGSHYQPGVSILDAAEQARALLAGLGAGRRQQHERDAVHLRRLGLGVAAVARDHAAGQRAEELEQDLGPAPSACAPRRDLQLPCLLCHRANDNPRGSALIPMVFGAVYAWTSPSHDQSGIGLSGSTGVPDGE